MSLLSNAMKDCVLLNSELVPDGYGGHKTQYTEGMTFSAAFVKDNSLNAQVAAVQGVTGLYTITTSRSVILRFHDIIKRISDGMTFLITTDAIDVKTPKSAGLDMRQCSAQEYDLPGA